MLLFNITNKIKYVICEFLHCLNKNIFIIAFKGLYGSVPPYLFGPM